MTFVNDIYEGRRMLLHYAETVHSVIQHAQGELRTQM